jgi:transcriptional regulator with XRE-family HTH domain
MVRILEAGKIRRIEVAAAAGCSPATVGKIANGDVASISIALLMRVAAAIGVAPVEIVPILGIRPRGGLLEKRGFTRG